MTPSPARAASDLPFPGPYGACLDAFYGTFGDEVVFLDLETTGIDPVADRIVEIGAARYRGYREVGLYETLVRPGVRFPRRIAHLTGLTEERLADAPPFEEARGPLTRFLGDAPIFAHNADFDRSFLERALGGLPNPCHDTCLFACLVFPDLVRYSLDHLVERFGLPARGTHSGLSDALLTKEMLDRLVIAALSRMPFPLMERLVRALAPAERSLATFVEALFRARDALPGTPAGADPPASPVPSPDPALASRLRDLSRGGGAALLHAPRGVPRAAAILDAALAASDPHLVLLPDEESLPRFRAAAPNTPDLLFLDRLFDHVCPPRLDATLEAAAARGELDANGFYLKLLLARRPLLSRGDLSPYMIHRSPESERLIRRACENGLECADASCAHAPGCRIVELARRIGQVRVVVTPLSNLYVLHRLGRGELLAGRSVIVDAPERFDGFFEPRLDALSFADCLELFGSIARDAQAGRERDPALAERAALAFKYLERLVDFLRDETAESSWPIPLRRDTPKYEEHLCFLLDFHIQAANLEKAAAGGARPRVDERALSDLARVNRVLADFFQGDGKLHRCLRAEGDDVRLELFPAEGAAPLAALLRRRPRSTLAVSGALRHLKVRERVLEATGLSAAGEFEPTELSAESGPDFIAPREMPESSVQKQALFDEKFRELVLRLARETPGRMLVVFNSTARLKTLGPQMAADLEALPDLLVLRQYHDGGKEKMHRAALALPRFAILGSAGFYGVCDVEEESVDLVVVEKAPFPHVQNELVALRRSRLRARGFDDYDDYMVPTMLLKMGSISRRIARGGALVVADGRLRGMNYYPLVLEAVAPRRVHDSIDAYLRAKGGPA